MMIVYDSTCNFLGIAKFDPYELLIQSPEMQRWKNIEGEICEYQLRRTKTVISDKQYLGFGYWEKEMRGDLPTRMGI